MAVLDDTQRQEVRDAFMRMRNIGGLTKPELRAAIDDTDDWLDANLTSLNTAVPEPFRSVATLEQKTLLLCHVLLRRAGILSQGGI